MLKKIQVEVTAIGMPFSVWVSLPVGSICLREAITESGIRSSVWNHKQHHTISVNGKLVEDGSYNLQANDCITLLQPLQIDPKQVRRELANARKKT